MPVSGWLQPHRHADEAGSGVQVGDMRATLRSANAIQSMVLRKFTKSGEFVQTFEMLMMGRLGDPAKYIELPGWEIVGLDIEDVEIKSRYNGSFRLIGQRNETFTCTLNDRKLES